MFSRSIVEVNFSEMTVPFLAAGSVMLADFVWPFVLLLRNKQRSSVKTIVHRCIRIHLYEPTSLSPKRKGKLMNGGLMGAGGIVYL